MTKFGIAFDEDELLGCLSLRASHPFIINLNRYQSVEEFIKEITIKNLDTGVPQTVLWVNKEIQVGSKLYNKLVERAITCMFLQNQECMAALLTTSPRDLRMYLETKESGADLLPPHELEDILLRLRQRNMPSAHP